MKIKYRKATTNDVELLLPLALELMAHNRSLVKGDKTRSELLKLVSDIKKIWRSWAVKQIKSPDGYIIIAENDNKIIGYAMNYIGQNTKVYAAKEIGHISDLYIKRGYRNKGIATKFKQLAFRWFKRKGMKYVSIAVHAENKKAHSIYKNWGFFDYHIELRRKL